MAGIKNLPGSYVLILDNRESRQVRVGRHLALTLRLGHYLYVGSARGPGGLKARLGHHMRKPERMHWHIDYLRQYAMPQAIWYIYGNHKLECQWAALFPTIGELYNPIKGFGASDCACDSHLMYASIRPDIELFKRTVMQQTGGLCDIEYINLESGEDGKR